MSAANDRNEVFTDDPMFRQRVANISSAEEDEESDNASLLHNYVHPIEKEVDGKFPKARQVLGFLGFLGFANVYAMRVNLSVAIVAMVNSTNTPVFDNNTDVCPMPPISNSTFPEKQGEFNWDEATQGIILGSFFYGYVLTQVPGGRLAEKYGGKYIYGYGVLITSLFTLLTPIAAKISVPAFILVRILEGMGEGVTFPAMHAILSRWVPPLERSRFAAYVYAGANLGTIISLPLSGYLCSLESVGWASVFYIFGAIGIVWFGFWMYFVANSPSEHPRISPEEKRYIELACQIKDHDGDEDYVPWRAIFTSVPVWAILITQCGQSWAFYTILSDLPTYMRNILHFNIKQNAVLSALPYLTSWIFAILCSNFADWLLRKQYITQIASYKLWNAVASMIPAVALLGVGYVGCDKVAVMFMLAGLGSAYGAVYSGNQMNHIALSPRHAGTLYGLTNAAANICGFLAPYVIGVLIQGRDNLTQWREVFYLAAVLDICGSFIYILFASADQQPWSTQRRSRIHIRN